jgi:hypothetical protein
MSFTICSVMFLMRVLVLAGHEPPLQLCFQSSNITILVGSVLSPTKVTPAKRRATETPSNKLTHL